MIGLIFGETDFPKQILKKVKLKEKYLIIDLTKNKFFKKDKNSYTVSIGQFGKIISILKKNNCKKVLLAGKINKPNFSKLKLDFKGIYYFPRIIKSSKLGDAAILKEIIKIFKKEKIKTVSSTIFTPELSLLKGNYSKIRPNIQNKKDISESIKALNKTNAYNYSQGAVSRNNKVIAIEGKGGTEKMLKQIKNKGNGVLVKFPKKKQDIRVDLPTIGLNTFRQCKKAGLRGIALKHKKNIILDKKKCIQYANKNKMFVLVK
ncbi:UDP-2,3-diacylglucosamine diphosphatase LpxI [Pelagibacteraceae bacterium]|nr:UDP-2,3-diacylglucosamine diphosphatase LpxI [Pelagibacteraceae bacterium]